MINLTWDAYADYDCDSFNIYRAVPGFVINFPNSLQSGDVLNFAATSSVIQSITFAAVDIDSVVSTFNDNALGAIATKTMAGTAIIIRLTATTDPRLKLYPCTFLTHLGEEPRIIVPGLEFNLIGNVPTAINTTGYSFTDNDGTQYDAYDITSVKSSVESLPSLTLVPQIGTDLLCAVEGRFCDSQNKPVVGLLVTAKVSTNPHTADDRGLYGYPVSTKTDTYGRFSLSLTRNAIYILSIPDVGYNWSVKIPDLPATDFVYLVPTVEDRFSPFGDPQ